MNNNTLAKKLAIIAGILLLISGSTGVAELKAIAEFIIKYVSDSNAVVLTFQILIIIASFGGLSVILGAILIGKRKVFLGKLFIKLGSGAGIIRMIISLTLALMHGKMISISSSTLASVGIILSLAAIILAK